VRRRRGCRSSAARRHARRQAAHCEASGVVRTNEKYDSKTAADAARKRAFGAGNVGVACRELIEGGPESLQESRLCGRRDHPRTAPPLTVVATSTYHKDARNTASSRKLRTIKAPTLVILGGKDGLVGNATAAARRARNIPNCEIEILPQAAHIMSVDESEFVGERIVNFLEAEDPRRMTRPTT
jgi:pimeloyl-ACP methyl ester carboxylesterase